MSLRRDSKTALHVAAQAFTVDDSSIADLHLPATLDVGAARNDETRALDDYEVGVIKSGE